VLEWWAAGELGTAGRMADAVAWLTVAANLDAAHRSSDGAKVDKLARTWAEYRTRLEPDTTATLNPTHELIDHLGGPALRHTA
jgi:predicted YcjX-like family ATPase